MTLYAQFPLYIDATRICDYVEEVNNAAGLRCNDRRSGG